MEDYLDEMYADNLLEGMDNPSEHIDEMWEALPDSSIAPTPSKSRPDQPPKNMSLDERDLYNEPDGEFYVHLIPSAGKFIDGGEFNEREDKSIKRILDIIGKDRLDASDKGIMFDSLSKYGAEIIRRSLRKAGLGNYADMGNHETDW